jgi:hypothetical protein
MTKDNQGSMTGDDRQEKCTRCGMRQEWLGPCDDCADNDRRERWRRGLGYLHGIAPDPIIDRPMAVADAERASLQSAFDKVTALLAARTEENDRLRTELERWTKLTDAYKNGAKLAAEKFHAEIDMLRNALDALGESND